MDQIIKTIPTVVKRLQDQNVNIVNSNHTTINSNAASINNQKKCWFCGEDHLSRFCEKFNTRILRSRALRDKGVCSYCLAAWHYPQPCQNTPSCRLCKKEGHTVIFCEKNC